MKIMNHFLPGLLAIILGITVSAYMKPVVILSFKLTEDPIFPYIVNNPEKWSTIGKTFGECAEGNGIACIIFLSSNKTSYYHVKGKEYVLNTFEFANTRSPKQDYLVIIEKTSNIRTNRIIVGIREMHFNGSAFVIDSFKTDIRFRNGKD